MSVNTGKNNNTGIPNNGINLNEVIGGNNSNNGSGVSGGRSKSLGNLMTRISSIPVSINQTNAVLNNWFNALLKKMDESITSSREEFELKIFDGSRHNLPISLISFIHKAVVENKQALIVVPLLIEASGEKLGEITRAYNTSGQMNNTQTNYIKYDNVPAFIFDNRYIEVLTESLRSTYNCNSIFITGLMVVPSEKKHDDMDYLHKLIHASINAIFRMTNENQPITPDAFQNISIQTAVDLNPSTTTTIDGMPVRTQFTIETQAITKENSNSSRGNMYGMGMTTRALTKMSGFVDFEFSSNSATNGFNGSNGYGMVDTRRFKPIFVISDVEALTDSVPMELLLLAFAGIPAIIYQRNWYQIFRPRVLSSSKGFNPSDIGGLGYEVNFKNNPEFLKITTDDGTFSDQNLCELLDAACFDPYVAIDIPDNGVTSFLLNVIQKASMGNTKSIQEIMNSANQLTNGIFGETWTNYAKTQPNASFFESRNTRIPLGYYVDRDGVKQDIRILDYLFNLNYHGKKNPERRIDFGNIFSDTNSPWEIRLDRLLTATREILSPNITVKGYANRYLINPQFIKILQSAIISSGINFGMKQMYSSFGVQDRTSNLNSINSFDTNAFNSIPNGLNRNTVNNFNSNDGFSNIFNQFS